MRPSVPAKELQFVAGCGGGSLEGLPRWFIDGGRPSSASSVRGGHLTLGSVDAQSPGTPCEQHRLPDQ